MKRSEIRVGQILALQTSKHQEPARAEVIDLGPWVASHSAAYSWQAPKAEVLTLADGSRVQAAARAPKHYDSATERGVLVRVTREAPSYAADQSDQVTVEVARLNTLRGHYDDVMGARLAERQRQAEAARQAAAERQRRADHVAGLNERAQEILGTPSTVVSEVWRGAGAVQLDSRHLAELLALAYLGAQHRPV